MNRERPGEIRAMSLHEVLNTTDKNFVIESDNGSVASGRTMHILLEMLSRVDPTQTAFQALCVCFTSESATEYLQNMEVLLRTRKYTKLTSQFDPSRLDCPPITYGPPDSPSTQVVIGTPDGVSSSIFGKEGWLTSVKILVFDDTSHIGSECCIQNVLGKIMGKIVRSSPECQVLLFSATSGVWGFVKEVVPYSHEWEFVKIGEPLLEFDTHVDSTPWLILSHRRDEPTTHTLFSLSAKSRHKATMPELHGKYIWSTPFHWWVVTDLLGGCWLLHPLSKEKILLPQLEIRQDYLGDLFILSASPNDRNCRVFYFNLRTKTIYFCRPNDVAFSRIQLQKQLQCACMVGETLFGVMDGFELYTFTINSVNGIESVEATEVLKARLPNPLFKEATRFEQYLIECSGELICVWKMLSSIFPEEVLSLKIFKWEGVGLGWVELDNMDDHVVFLGLRSGMCCPLKRCTVYFTEFPESRDDMSLVANTKLTLRESRFHGNRVYFTEAYGGHVSVYDIESGGITNLPPFPEVCEDSICSWVLLPSSSFCSPGTIGKRMEVLLEDYEL